MEYKTSLARGLTALTLATSAYLIPSVASAGSSTNYDTRNFRNENFVSQKTFEPSKFSKRVDNMPGNVVGFLANVFLMPIKVIKSTVEDYNPIKGARIAVLDTAESGYNAITGTYDDRMPHEEGILNMEADKFKNAVIHRGEKTNVNDGKTFHYPTRSFR